MNRQTGKDDLGASSLIDLRRRFNGDKAGKTYWDQTYSPEYTPRGINPNDDALKNFVERQFHRYFLKTLSSMKGKEFLEVGCGGSQYLPYFSKEFGFRVSGIDYSEAGCASASRILAREGVSGEVIRADLFDPPQSLYERFDVVVSFGVVEHFEDTKSCLAAIARFAKPGGLVLTFIPNMVGLVGRLQKAFDRHVFEKHVLLDKMLLRQAHEQAGLLVQECDYFIFNTFFVVNMNDAARRSAPWYLKTVLLQCLHYASGAIWALETAFHPFRPSRFISPYIACTARASESKCASLESGLRDGMGYVPNRNVCERRSDKKS